MMESCTEQQDVMLFLSLLTVFFMMVLFYSFFFEWLYFCFPMQSQDTVEGQILSYISITSRTPWSCRESWGSLQNSSASGSVSDVPQMSARAPVSMPAMAAPCHPNKAFTLDLPQGSNYSRPRMQLLVKNLGYSLEYFLSSSEVELQWKEDFRVKTS